MNRYPVWKYVLIVFALTFGALYTLPNFYSSSPALQINSAKSTVKVESDMEARVTEALKSAAVPTSGVFFSINGTQGSVKARFADPDTQFKAKAALDKALNPDATDPAYSVTFNTMSNTPEWLQSMRALPMFLGLDLRGGVHFLMQVDTNAVLTKRLQGLQSSIRTTLREKDIRHAGIERNAEQIVIKFTDAAILDKARNVLQDQQRDVDFAVSGSGSVTHQE